MKAAIGALKTLFLSVRSPPEISHLIDRLDEQERLSEAITARVERIEEHLELPEVIKDVVEEMRS